MTGSGSRPVGCEVLQGGMVYDVDGLTVVRLDAAVEVPVDFGIISACPNPFNVSTTITYGLPFASRVSLVVFDLSGRRIAMLLEGHKQPGIHTTTLTVTNLPSGLYFVRLETSEKVFTQKVILIR